MSGGKQKTGSLPVFFIFILGIGLAICTVILSWLNRSTTVPEAWGFRGFQTYFGSLLLVFSSVVAWRQPRNAFGWVLLAASMFALLTGFNQEYTIYGCQTCPGGVPAPQILGAMLHWMWIPSMGLIAIFSFAIFPTGKFISPRWHWLGWLGAAWILLSVLLVFFFPGPLGNLPFIENPFGIAAMTDLFPAGMRPEAVVLGVGIPLMLIGAFSLILRYRRADTQVRQQIKWMALVGWATPIMGIIGQFNGWLPDILLAGAVTANIGALAIAILYYRLYNVDLAINRTLVYGGLTILIFLVYILAVGALGSLLPVGQNIFLAFFITALVAVLFQPIRDRLQAAVNRLMYGDRDDPVSVLTKLGQQLERTGTPADSLKGITRTMAETLKLPYVGIQMAGDDQPVAAYGMPGDHVLSIPMVYQNEVNGYLLVAPRSTTEAFSQSERSLLENIARQAGAVAHSARLTEDLRQSRQRIVTAREEERRRIRRDLHDGLGPQLASQTLTLDAIEKQIERDPTAAKQLIRDLKTQSQQAIRSIRSLIYDLRPPALDDLGLVTALNQSFMKYASVMQVKIHAPDDLPSLPAAVEVAAYNIIQEAVLNTARYANARNCRISLALASADLCITVDDDGRGFPPDLRSGVGMVSMRERASELGGQVVFENVPGGGARVIVSLPLPGEDK